MQALHFRISEGLFEIIRSAYWYENRKKWANRCLDCLDGITKAQKKRFLSGDAVLLAIKKGTVVEYQEREDTSFKKELTEHLNWLKECKKKDAESRRNAPEVRAYVLFVFHNWKLTNDAINSDSEYHRRSTESIQESEFCRQKLHKEAVSYLKWASKLSDKKIISFLEHECEKETKRILPDLKDGEHYCGCCRMVVEGTCDSQEHGDSGLHTLLSDEVERLAKMYQTVRISKMMDSMKEKEK